MTTIRGKWALITGASRGVGQQIALGMAQKGVNLVLHSSSITNQTDTMNLLAQYAIRIEQVECDLREPKAIATCIQAAENKSDGIDIVYNNAAIMTRFVDLFDAPMEDYQFSL